MPTIFCATGAGVRNIALFDRPEAPLQSLLEGIDNDRRFAGPGPWLAVLKER